MIRIEVMGMCFEKRTNEKETGTPIQVTFTRVDNRIPVTLLIKIYRCNMSPL